MKISPSTRLERAPRGACPPIHQTTRKQVEMMSQLDWTTWATQFGLAGMLGLAFGYTSKKAFKFLLIGIALIVAVSLFLEKNAFISIHWDQVESVYRKVFPEPGTARTLLEKFAISIGALIPVTGGFLAGFLVGFARG